MVTTLSKLVEMIQSGAVPAWVRDYILAHQDEIVIALRENGAFTIPGGPNGEQVSIRAEKRESVAA
ncbi:MAG: hypothetical protein WAN12_07050 [Candidatus Acidiferrum sp.]